MMTYQLPPTPQQLFAHKKVLLFGLGLQGGGLGDVQSLLTLHAQVRITDLKTPSQLAASLSQLPPNIPTTLGKHSYQDIDWADIIIKNPGVPDNNAFIQYAYQKHKMVLGTAALLLYYTPATTIGITGTRGKSTTTHLIYNLLNNAFPNRVAIGGNIPGKSSLALLLQNNYDYLVLELSSFQLSSFHHLHISPHIAVVTNIYHDHLNYYSTFTDYLHDKLAIVAYQKPVDYTVLNKYDAYAAFFASHTVAKTTYFTYSRYASPLPGTHNKRNLAAATKVAHIFHLSPSLIRKTFAAFTGLPYRQQKIAIKRGITFINDTTSTTPIALITAINSLTQPAVMIVGGASKNLPIKAAVRKLATNRYVKKIVILGSQDNSQLTSLLHKMCPQKIIGQAFSMKRAIDLALNQAKSGWAIVLSPGFASFDLFKNEFDRGQQFNKIVHSL